MFARSISALVLASMLSATAAAHFVFIVPQAGDKARVIFSDNLEPDKNVPVTKIAATKLMMRDLDGTVVALPWKKGAHAYDVNLAGGGSRIVYGSTDFGVLQKGKDAPFLLRYYPKAIVGPIPADRGKLGKGTALELIPVLVAGKVAFEVYADNKPLAHAQVNVILGGGKKSLETDDRGRTPAITAAGKCAAWVKHSKAMVGTWKGKAYEEVRNYATLVVELPAR